MRFSLHEQREDYSPRGALLGIDTLVGSHEHVTPTPCRSLVPHPENQMARHKSRDQLFFAPCVIQCRSNSSSAGAKGVTLDVSGGILKWG
jgi:hypothetical protein